MSNKTNGPKTTITVDQLKSLMSSGQVPRMLDVRTGGEFQSVHIAGSHNIPLDTLNAHLTELASADQPLVVVCQSGGRADQACQRLAGSGHSSVAVLEGGIAAWEAADGDVVKGESTTWAMERQVRFVAGSLVMLFVVLSVFVPGVQWLAAAVGFGLWFSAVSNTCTMANILGRLPYNRSSAGTADVSEALAGLSR